jgi:hypothetical protein
MQSQYPKVKLLARNPRRPAQSSPEQHPKRYGLAQRCSEATDCIQSISFKPQRSHATQRLLFREHGELHIMIVLARPILRCWPTMSTDLLPISFFNEEFISFSVKPINVPHQNPNATPI